MAGTAGTGRQETKDINPYKPQMFDQATGASADRVVAGQGPSGGTGEVRMLGVRCSSVSFTERRVVPQTPGPLADGEIMDT